jgi:hypothetical protein
MTLRVPSGDSLVLDFTIQPTEVAFTLADLSQAYLTMKTACSSGTTLLEKSIGNGLVVSSITNKIIRAILSPSECVALAANGAVEFMLKLVMNDGSQWTVEDPAGAVNVLSFNCSLKPVV